MHFKSVLVSLLQILSWCLISPSARSEEPPAEMTPVVETSNLSIVIFNLGSRGTIGCGDSQRKDVDGSATLTFKTAKLPVSCMVVVEGKMWAGLITESGRVNCRSAGGDLICVNALAPTSPPITPITPVPSLPSNSNSAPATQIHVPKNSGTIWCHDGTRSPSCYACNRGCCSGHGGCK